MIFRHAAVAAATYAALGWNPLPSRADAKKPAIREWRHLREEAIPEKWLAKWWAPNIQVITGARWRLAVVDIDGERALDAWQAMTRFRAMPPTWTVASGGADFGMHLWYTLPWDVLEFPTRLVWGLWDSGKVNCRGKVVGGWDKRAEVKILGDGQQVVAPPSVHPKTGQPYQFLDGLGPTHLARPATMPDWLLDCPAFESPQPVKQQVGVPMPPKGPRIVRVGRYHWMDVLHAIPDKVALAATWGVRLASEVKTRSRWRPCHSIYRPDEDPSAGISETTGNYWEPEFGHKPICIFRLAVELGIYRSWPEAVDQLGHLNNARKGAGTWSKSKTSPK